MKTRKPKPTTYEQVHDNHAMVLRVEEGLPVMDVVNFGKQAGFTNEELAKMINVPARTYARRIADRGRLKIAEGERAARIMRIFDRAKQLFVTEEDVRKWLHAELPALGWRTPIDYAQTEPGAREVENLIGRIEHGVFS